MHTVGSFSLEIHMSALKQGKITDYETVRSTRPKRSNAELEAGIELHDFLVDEFISGELNNTQVATIAQLHQRNCGSGLESLACSSSSHGKHSVVKRYLEATYGHPDTVQVPVPTYNRQSCLREIINVPVQLPTTIFRALTRPL